jgi:glyoxylase I family protein
VFVDADRAGSGLLNFAVDNLEHHIAELRRRGLRPSEIVDANKGVRLSTISDPDGNTITLIGGFRVNYQAPNAFTQNRKLTILPYSTGAVGPVNGC